MEPTIDYETYCPACDNEIAFEKQPKFGQLCTCSHCNTELEVVDLEPLTLDWVYDDEDDDYDFDDEDDDYGEP